MTTQQHKWETPRVTVIVAPHREAARGLRLNANTWLPAEGPEWLRRLCGALGLPPGDDPYATLVEQTEAALRRASVPAAVPLADGEGAETCSDPLLVVAMLSRASPNLVLTRRTPRFDRDRLARERVAFVGSAQGGTR